MSIGHVLPSALVFQPRRTSLDCDCVHGSAKYQNSKKALEDGSKIIVGLPCMMPQAPKWKAIICIGERGASFGILDAILGGKPEPIEELRVFVCIGISHHCLLRYASPIAYRNVCTIEEGEWLHDFTPH